jgi:solute:Na+ symporter, SSS family
MHHLHPVDYAIIVGYLVLTTVVGMILTRRASKSLDHYFLGNRTLPWWLLGIAGMSNWFDLTGTMIITSFLYMLGPRGLYIEFRGGAVLVLAFMLAYVGKWHRRSGCMTGAEWLTYRFGRLKSVEAVRVVKAVVTIVVTIVLLAYLVRGTSLFLGIIIPYPPVTMTIFIIALTTLYTMCAGFYGVVVTDLIQGVIIVASCLVIAVMAWTMIPDSQHLTATAQAVTGNGQWVESLPAWHTSMPKGYEQYQFLIVVAAFYVFRNVLGGMGMGDESRYFGARDDRACGLQSFLQGITVMFRWPLMIGFAVMGIYLVHDTYRDSSVIAGTSESIRSHFPSTTESQWHDLTNQIAAKPENYPPAMIDSLRGQAGELSARDD